MTEQIEIDDLNRDEEEQYWLRWTEGNVIIFALLARSEGSSYQLDCWYDSLRRMGAIRLGRKQQGIGEKILPLARAQMLEAMRAAGWREAGDAWQKVKEQDSVTPHQDSQRKVLSVSAGQGNYQRTITTQNVTLTCKRCGDHVTRTQYPGRQPLYCEPCAAQMRKEKTRARVARLRAGKKEVRSK